MADSFTTSLRLVQMPTGSNDTTWGVKADAAFALVDEAVAGSESISVTAGNVTLTTANNATDQSRKAMLTFTGTPGAERTVTMPDVSKLTWMRNSSDSSIVFTAGAGTTVTLAAGKKVQVFTDGATNAISLGAIIDIASADITGTLAVANGGTGVTTSTGTGATVRAVSPSLTTPNIGAATASTVNGNTVTSGTGTLTLSTFTLTVSGTANVSGTHSGTSSGTNTGDQTWAGLGGKSMGQRDVTIQSGGSPSGGADGDIFLIY